MSYYNYNNTSVILGSGNENHHFAVDSVGISLQNNLTPLSLIPDKSSFDYKSTQGLNGSLDLTYYLTGQDFLANFIENERNFISGNFAGLTFSSGYLTSYGFNVQHYGSIRISANINFYGGLEGTFTPTHETSVVTGARPLNYVNTTLTGVSGELPASNELLQKAESVDYSFSSEITPVYVVGQQLPREVRFNQKTTNVSINGYDLTKYTTADFASGLYDTEMTIGFSTPNKNEEFPYYSSDFVSDSDGWNVNNMTVTAPDTHDGQPHTMRANATATNSVHNIYRTVFEPGRSYRIKGKIYISSDQINQVQLRYSVADTQNNPDTIALSITTVGEWVDFETGIVTPNNQYLWLDGLKNGAYFFSASTADKFWIKDLKVIPVHAQEYKTRGTLTSQSIEVSAGEKLKTSISLIQNKIGNAPSIMRLSSNKKARGEEVTIFGSHLISATSVSFGDSKIQAVDFVEVDSVNNTIKVNVPNDAIDSFITVRTPGGNDTYTAAVFEVTDDGF